MDVKLDYPTRCRVMIGMLDNAIRKKAPDAYNREQARSLARKAKNDGFLEEHAALMETLGRYRKMERYVLGDPLRDIPGHNQAPVRRPRPSSLEDGDETAPLPPIEIFPKTPRLRGTIP